MARRVRQNAFDTNRPDAERSGLTSLERPADAPAVDMRSILPPVGPAKSSSPSAKAVPHSPPSGTEPAAPQKPMSKPRGAGGRPPARIEGITVSAARIPLELYGRTSGLVTGKDRPSWGQLIAWICQEHPDEVVARTVSALEPARKVVLSPRGGSNLSGSGGQQVTARFIPAEQEVFAATKDAAVKAVEAAGVAPAAKVTTTRVIIAALEVAAEKPPTTGE